MDAIRERALEVALGCYSEGGCSGLAEYERREVVASIIDAYVSALAAAGFTIIHRDENHGPTRDRAAWAADEALRQYEDCDGPRQSTVAAIRAMEVKP